MREEAPAVLLRVTACGVRLDGTVRSALDSPSTEAGAPLRGVTAFTTDVSGAGVSRAPGMFTISCGRP